jgi:acetate kinase
MGWTPLEGLVMATRSGSIDPGAVIALVRALGADAVEHGLDREAGLAGLAGVHDGDLRAVLAAREAGAADARVAFDVYLHRLRRELGSMIAVLGGLDVLVFTGGVGEHSPDVREGACALLGFAGVTLDAPANAALEREGEIGAPEASVRTFVVTAREDAEIARETRIVLGTKDPM